jgi:hypothetical protein
MLQGFLPMQSSRQKRARQGAEERAPMLLKDARNTAFGAVRRCRIAVSLVPAG